MDYIQLSHNHYTEETLLLPFAFTDLVAKISGETKQAGSFTVELKYFRSMPWYKAIFLSNFF
ncbi:hypothetical protein P7H47_12360, partial [Enterococcus cecorum]|nr:hypothetical protein [Enterococcus cecorum]